MITFTRRSRLSAYGLMGLLLAGCATVSAQEPGPTVPLPAPVTSIADNGTVLIPPLVIEAPVPIAAAVVPVEPSNCLDGSAYTSPTLMDLDGACTWTHDTLRALVDRVFGQDAERMSRDIGRESGWNPNALGPKFCRRGRCARAIGLTQLLGWTGLAQRLGVDIWSPYGNLVTAREVLRLQGWSAWSTDRG